mmetsp:Transcript_71849/g.131545  ORF Transcript_71849/g.131545 Transcript_71849/m.131545 type:complete len:787 (+) Transcript_71849:82-2442(+)
MKTTTTCGSEPGAAPRKLAILAACSGFFFFVLPSSKMEGRQLLSLELDKGAGLRGGRSLVTDFQWEQSTSVGMAGVPFHTSLLALDSHGRPVRAAAASALLANVTVTGAASLALSSPGLIWHKSRLELVLEDRMSETVEVQVHLWEPNTGFAIDAPVLKIKFTSAPIHNFDMQVVPVGMHLGDSSAHKATWYNGVQNFTFPTHIVLDVTFHAQDKFGNEVKFDTEGNESALCNSGLSLRTSSAAVELLHHGVFGFEESGARAQIRGTRPGIAEILVEHSGSTGEVSMTEQVLRVNFVSYEPPQKAALLKENSTHASSSDAKWQHLAVEVREAFLHAWQGYRRHAWGNDELKPLSKHGKDTFGNIGMIVLDSLTTLWLMGLHNEFERATTFVEQDLDFDTADREISVFEINIRALGGLLGAHSLSGRKIFLTRALELGERLLPALNSSSGLPWPRWNIARQGQVPTKEPTILAEAGTLQLEFRHLTALTGDTRFRDAADQCFNTVQATSSAGLKSVHLTPPWETPARALPDKIQLGALADSYYEYLLKQWVQSPQEGRFKELFLKFMEELPHMVMPKPESTQEGPIPKYKLIEANPDGRVVWKMDHLSCFTPGMIALGLRRIPASDLDDKQRNMWLRMAEGLTASCAELWTSTKSGLAPEFAFVEATEPFKFGAVPPHGHHSFLRPETAESLFYLYRITGDVKYRRLGKKIFHAIVKNAKTDIGFASVQDVNTMPTTKLDEMQSFVMAETFKYLYLLFAPADTLDIDKYVLNTEAHPLRILGVSQEH